MGELREDVFREALLTIRDSTFRNAMQLRAIAQRALEADQPIPYTVTEAGKAAVHCDRCDYECVCTNNKRLFPGVG